MKTDLRTSIVATPAGAKVKVIERGGTGAPMVFLHSGVGTAGEWRQVFDLWPDSRHLVAVDVFGGGAGPGRAGSRTLNDFADQVYGVARHLGEPLHLVGFSWGGATALGVGLSAPEVLASLTVIEPEAYGVLTPADQPAHAVISALRERWRGHVRADRWEEACQEFVDFYNGSGSFARWPADRRTRFLGEQRKRGDLWEVLFRSPLTVKALKTLQVPVHVIEGSATSVVDHAICRLVLRHLPRSEHHLIDGAGHMIPLTHPGVLTETLVDTVARTGTQSPTGFDLDSRPAR